jgi:hypothetical protein
MKRRFVVALLAALCLICCQPKRPKSRLAELGSLESVENEVVFVKKDLFGGDLEYHAIQKGRVRNISSKPITGVKIVWVVWGYDPKSLLKLRLPKPDDEFEYRDRPCIFMDTVEYLAPSAEADFSISVPLRSAVGEEIARFIKAGNTETGIYVDSRAR